MKKEIVNWIIILIGFLFIFSFWGFYSAIRPSKIISTVKPNNFGVNYENISFLTEDNILIRGWFIPSKKTHAKTIILLHGYPADKGDILPSMIFLQKNYNLLLMDFRYLGQSGGSYTTIGKEEVKDLVAAIRYLHSRGIHEVAIWGFSLGAAVALMTAPRSPEIKLIIADSSFARLDWMAYEYYHLPGLRYPLGLLTRFWAWLFLGYDIKEVSPLTAAKQLTIPVLLIHSKQDNVTPFSQALLLQKALEKNSKAKFLLEGETQHGESIKNYEQIIQAFLENNNWKS